MSHEGFEQALRAVRDVEGWLTREQAWRLYDRAASLPDSARIVEIGSYHGRSTIVLAEAAPGSEVVTIDPYATDEDPDRAPGKLYGVPRDLERLQANLERAGVRGRVRHVRDFSTSALEEFDGEVDLLYIDGAHDLPSALADIRAWGARVRPGGTMFVHDSFSAVGVTIAEILTLFFTKEFRYVGRSRSLAEYRRERVSLRSRLSGATRQAAALPWFLRNVAVKAAMVNGVPSLARLLGHTDDMYPY